MRTLIESCISFTKIGKHPKSEYNYTVGRARLKRESMEFEVTITTNFVFPYADIEKMKKIIKKEFSDISKVSFHFIYEDVILSPREIVELYLDHMIEKANETYENEVLKIKALGAFAVKELNEKVAVIFGRLLLENFGLSTKVIFENNEDTYEEKTKEKEHLDAIEMEAVHHAILKAESEAASPTNPTSGLEKMKEFGWKSQGGKSTASGSKYTPVQGNRIMGKAITGDVSRIKELERESGLVILEGQVFRKESRQLKNGKQLVSLLMTDGTDSICVKIFATEEKWQDIDEHIKEGTNIRIRGNIEYDTYENMIVLMGKDLEKV